MMNRRYKKRCGIVVLALGLTALLLRTIWANTALECSFAALSDEKLPEEFSGFTIAQVSDLHNTEFGDDNADLLRLLRDTAPDIIAITGDLIDSRRTDVSVALEFAEKAAEIAPVYYVTGNHESRVDEYSRLEARLKAAGVTVLRNECMLLEREGAQIRLIGLDDPSFAAQTDASKWADAILDTWVQDQDAAQFTLLLSHRPELFSVYAAHQMDLVLSGHAHGGQIRLPLIGGLFAPNQGLFPAYDAGPYTDGTTTMVVSRGLGNSLFPLRVNNRPELVVITLQTAQRDDISRT